MRPVATPFDPSPAFPCKGTSSELAAIIEAERPTLQHALGGVYRVEIETPSTDTTFRNGTVLVRTSGLEGDPTNYASTRGDPPLLGLVSGGYAIVGDDTRAKGYPDSAHTRGYFAEVFSFLQAGLWEINDCAGRGFIPSVIADCRPLGINLPVVDAFGQPINSLRPGRFDETVRRLLLYFGKPANKRAVGLGELTNRSCLGYPCAFTTQGGQ